MGGVLGRQCAAENPWAAGGPGLARALGQGTEGLASPPHVHAGCLLASLSSLFCWWWWPRTIIWPRPPPPRTSCSRALAQGCSRARLPRQQGGVAWGLACTWGAQWLELSLPPPPDDACVQPQGKEAPQWHELMGLRAEFHTQGWACSRRSEHGRMDDATTAQTPGTSCACTALPGADPCLQPAGCCSSLWDVSGSPGLGSLPLARQGVRRGDS